VFNPGRRQPGPGGVDLFANVHLVSVTSRSFSAV
jgi:hypothetical protein